ncbi:DUF916 and DUF3324 domain-containing protein [Candidatus Enterococcus mansonii]|uniref:Uncharacterized protein n=1 Tax=Candidatus Enterococcus mansonii TaxID=1834181 RepID=A0A242CFS8_9ENTE|nr:DUF916 and DUF3324 domain-containing protein [Enterococcus sp. 4G2_DIV0659]OTO08968.1 hypothetical protein A5880_001968 [Enterococcus sp. 4G2_DIV0659]
MKKKYLLPLIIIVMALSFSIHITNAFAADMNFSVEANIPKNQIDKSQTYFDLKMKPEQEQDISITIKNSSDEAATFTIEPHIAVTNQNGVIDYSKELEKDSSLNVGLTDVISGEEKYTLAPKETKKAVFHLKMPKESYDGIILGGFHIRKEQKDDKAGEKQSVQIKNQYAYVIGIKLRETDKSVQPELVLNNVKPALQNYRTVVTANIQNTQPVIINGLKVKAKISKENSDEVLHETEKQDMSMAPNSNFDFPINWNSQKLKAGTYHLSLVAEDDKEHKWTLEKTFKINGNESRKLNKEAVELEKDYTMWIILAVIMIILLLIIIWMIVKKQNEKKLDKRLAMERKRLKKIEGSKKKQVEIKKETIQTKKKNKKKSSNKKQVEK